MEQGLASNWTRRYTVPQNDLHFERLRLRFEIILDWMKCLELPQNPALDRKFTLDDLLDDSQPQDVVLRLERLILKQQNRCLLLFEQNSKAYTEASLRCVEHGKRFAREQWQALDPIEKSDLVCIWKAAETGPWLLERPLRLSRSEIWIPLQSELATSQQTFDQQKNHSSLVHDWLKGFFLELNSHCQFELLATKLIVSVQ